MLSHDNVYRIEENEAFNIELWSYFFIEINNDGISEIKVRYKIEEQHLILGESLLKLIDQSVPYLFEDDPSFSFIQLAFDPCSGSDYELTVYNVQAFKEFISAKSRRKKIDTAKLLEFIASDN